jgi:alpha/beta superfamily hydrolase
LENPDITPATPSVPLQQPCLGVGGFLPTPEPTFGGDSNNSFSVANPIVAGALNRISQDVDMVTIRFNYRFGWGNPVVARD